jgi:hypothetical protein
LALDVVFSMRLSRRECAENDNCGQNQPRKAWQ